jgi:hypothetical protein
MLNTYLVFKGALLYFQMRKQQGKRSQARLRGQSLCDTRAWLDVSLHDTESKVTRFKQAMLGA